MQILGPDVMSNKEGLQTRLRQLQKDFQRFEGDTGSPEVQGASLSSLKFDQTHDWGSMHKSCLFLLTRSDHLHTPCSLALR